MTTKLSIIEAIAKMEGWNASPDNIPTRDNNPGDIDDGRFAASQPGYEGAAGRFAKFDNATDGLNALRTLLLDSYAGLTISGALNKYAPPVENATNAYIAGVCELTGLEPDTILTEENIG